MDITTQLLQRKCILQIYVIIRQSPHDLSGANPKTYSSDVLFEYSGRSSHTDNKALTFTTVGPATTARAGHLYHAQLVELCCIVCAHSMVARQDVLKYPIEKSSICILCHYNLII